MSSRTTRLAGGLLAGWLLLAGCGGGDHPTRPRSPRTFRVPADQPTITDAAGLAGAADTILVAAGTYAEPELFLAAGVVLRGDGDGQPVVVDGRGGNGLHLSGGGADSTVIQDLTFRRLTVAQVRGRAAVRRCRFVGCGQYGAGVEVESDGAALFAGCVFDSCEVEANGLRGGALYSAGTVVLDGCTFRGNALPLYGGAGAYLQGSGVLIGCRFVDNHALFSGGALELEGPGPFALIDCDFENNSAGSEGGALRCRAAATFLQGCAFTDNHSHDGGALFCSTAAVVSGCSFLGNTAEDRGGAIVAAGAAPEFSGCILAGNQARKGGAFWTRDGRPILASCSLGGNRAGDGAGVYLEGGRLSLLSCSLSANRAGARGGALYLLGTAAPCSLSLTATAVTANRADLESGGIYVLAGRNLLQGSYATILENQAPAGADGVVGDGSAAVLRCCEIDTLRWDAPGRLTVIDEDCEFRRRAERPPEAGPRPQPPKNRRSSQTSSERASETSSIEVSGK